MKQMQIKHALARIDSLTNVHKKAACEALRQPKVLLRPEERYDLIAQRKVKLRTDISRIDQHTDVVEAFDFSKFENNGSPDTKKLAAAYGRIDDEANRLKDRIVLGDAEEALAVLEAFAGFKPL